MTLNMVDFHSRCTSSRNLRGSRKRAQLYFIKGYEAQSRGASPRRDKRSKKTRQKAGSTRFAISAVVMMAMMGRMGTSTGTAGNYYGVGSYCR